MLGSTLIPTTIHFLIALFPITDLLKNNDINDFYIIIENHEYNRINFSPEDIKARCNAGVVKLLTYEESINSYNKKNEIDFRGLDATDVYNITALALANSNLRNSQKQNPPNFLKRQTIIQGKEN